MTTQYKPLQILFLTGLLSSILLLFRIPVSHFLDFLFVTPVFQYFESGIHIDICVLFLSVCFIYWAFKILDKSWLLNFTILASLFFLFQRFNPYWHFKEVSFTYYLKYWDIVICTLIISTLIPYYYKKSIPPIEQETLEGFIEDTPVTTNDEDLFKRRIAATEIATLIKKTINKKSFAIGILGEYGSGKTSFLNLINRSLEEQYTVKIRFDSWSANTPDMIRREFFDLLIAKLAEIDPKISSLIYSYARKLSDIDEQSRLWINRVDFLRSGSRSIQNSTEYDKIDNMLRSIQKKIVISIDDLDRLYPAEIIEILKLIRNTAGFSNVFYLVAYDKAYLQKALNQLNDSCDHNYLDKIFQLEIPLPKRETDDLLAFLKTNIKSIVSEQHYQLLEDKIIPIGFHNQYNKNYSQIFRQSRDAVRFLNGFKITYRLIGEEVEFECLLILEFVKFRFPRVYDIIYEKSDQFLYRKPAISVYQEYFLPSILKNSNGGSSTKFRIYIDQLNYLKLEDKELLDNLFQMLFNGGEYYPPQASNSISYPLYFEVYFRSRLSSYDISDKEYKYALQSDKLIDFIRDCASKNLHQGLLTRFMQEDIYKSRTHFELIIQAIFNLGPLLITKSSLHSFPYGILQNKIDNYDNEIADNLYGGNTESYKSFIQSLFDNSRPNYLFENQLIYNIKERGREFILSAETLTAYQISYFKRYAESDHGLCPNAMWLFWGIREYYTIPGNRPDTFHKIWRFEPSVTPYIKKYLKDKDPKHFLKFSIQTEMRDKKSICIQKVVIDIFDEPAEYKNLIISNEALDPEIKSEYLQLFDKCEREGFQRYVNMELQTELRKEE